MYSVTVRALAMESIFFSFKTISEMLFSEYFIDLDSSRRRTDIIDAEIIFLKLA